MVGRVSHLPLHATNCQTIAEYRQSGTLGRRLHEFLRVTIGNNASLSTQIECQS
jgi:hypothetical protein